MHIRTCALGALILGSLALPASAQGIKPGLWEMTTKLSSPNGEMQGAMADMQKQMAAMSPEERKMMEQLMAKQGVQFSPGGDGAMRMQMCVTKEMAERNELPVQQQGGCTQKRSPMSGGTMKMSFSCSKPHIEGQGEVTLASDTSYRAKMKVTSFENGKPEVTNSEVAGKWLGADCGSVKPFAPPKQK